MHQSRVCSARAESPTWGAPETCPVLAPRRGAGRGSSQRRDPSLAKAPPSRLPGPAAAHRGGTWAAPRCRCRGSCRWRRRRRRAPRPGGSCRRRSSRRRAGWGRASPGSRRRAGGPRWSWCGRCRRWRSRGRRAAPAPPRPPAAASPARTGRSRSPPSRSGSGRRRPPTTRSARRSPPPLPPPRGDPATGRRRAARSAPAARPPTTSRHVPPPPPPPPKIAAAPPLHRPRGRSGPGPAAARPHPARPGKPAGSSRRRRSRYRSGDPERCRHGWIPLARSPRRAVGHHPGCFPVGRPPGSPLRSEGSSWHRLSGAMGDTPDRFQEGWFAPLHHLPAQWVTLLQTALPKPAPVPAGRAPGVPVCLGDPLKRLTSWSSWPHSSPETQQPQSTAAPAPAAQLWPSLLCTVELIFAEHSATRSISPAWNWFIEY